MNQKNGENIRCCGLIGGSLTRGTGLWAMHFKGMLAYYLPVSIAYNLPIVIVSWLAAVIASGIAFYSLHRGFAHRFSLLIPGTLMGAGIGSMHYRTHLRSFSDRPRLAIGSATGDRLSYWRSAFNCAMFEGQPKLGRVVGCP